MTEAQALPPARPQFDFGKPFTYVFDDPRWVHKILLGGLFFLAGFFLIGWFFLLGYVAQVTRNIIADHPRPLPEWDDLAAFFAEGARLIAVALVYVLPFLFIVATVVIPSMILTNVDNEGAQTVGGLMLGCLSCFLVPLGILVMVFMPASLLFAIVEQRFNAGFEFGRIWSFITRNIGNYLLAVVIYLIARFLGGFGMMLLCVGIIFTGFWSLLVTAHGFAQAYRLDPAR
ncbi:MAG TPA: DUF4013 domain-containing protein [Thermoanaerobaculia bacterium]|nr:DUF4013 domain-containing protein [Thermoanaerobaculia bacterium]